MALDPNQKFALLKLNNNIEAFYKDDFYAAFIRSMRDQK